MSPVRARSLPPLLLTLSAALLARSAPAEAQHLDRRAVIETPAKAPRNYVNLRVGASSGDRNGRPQICLEGSPLAWLSVEACGTGAGILHDDPAPEVAHFRAKLRFLRAVMSGGWALEAFGGAGIAEFQVGRDQAGFDFSGPGATGNETAGPEASAHLRAIVPLASGFDMVAEITAGAAWIPAGPELALPLATFQPSIGLSIGAGF